MKPNKIKVLLFISHVLIFLLSLKILAQPVTFETAKRIAYNKLTFERKEYLKSAILQKSVLSFSSVTSDVNEKETLYYIFNDTINNGFVIVAADERVWPVLGYSLDGKYSESNQPPAFTEWLEHRKREIAWVINNNLSSNETISREWSNLNSSNFITTANTEKVGPLLQTKWGQDFPYNEMCPIDTNGTENHTLVGCCGTAMAQLLKYYNYPNKGNGHISYTVPKYGLIEKNLSESIYKWEQMPNEIFSSNQEIAQLMFDCAISINTKFDINGSDVSSSDVAKALIKNFNYSKNLKYVYSDHYTCKSWLTLLKKSLSNLNPIYYTGAGTPAGHAMICDGFENDYFHLNFGWKGYCDGYYLLSSVTSENSNFNFSFLQSAIVDINPDDSEFVIDFHADNRVGFVPFSVNFKINPDISQSIKKIEWDFEGDGITDSKLENPTFIYKNKGGYNVSLKIITEKNSVVETKANFIIVLDDPKQNIIVNNITDNLLWNNSNYYITKNITVPEDKSLRINPGAKLLFLDSCKIIVNGSLYGDGTTTDSIQFNSVGPNNFWGGIVFNGNQGSKLNNCIVENCENRSFSLSPFNTYSFYSAIIIYNDNVVIEHCSILNNNCRGIEIWASPTIRYNCITNNHHADGAGIMIRSGNPLINNNKIFKNNGWNSGGALKIIGCSAKIINNYLYNNSQGAIEANSVKDLIIEGNIICNNFRIWSGGGGGIRITGYEKSNVRINNNTICCNYGPKGSALSIYRTEPTLYNNIIWGNSKGDTIKYSHIILKEAYPIFNNCIIEGLTKGIEVINDETEYPKDHLINCFGNNPNFINPTPFWNGNADLIINSNGLKANWNIGINSPGIDNGSNVELLFNCDISGKKRIWDGNDDGIAQIDIGAMECNSIYNDTIKIFENKIICQGQNYQGWTTSGTYKQSLQSVSGCDSMVTTNLEIRPSYQPEISQNGDTLKSVNLYKTYQWYNESGMIPGATRNKYVLSKSGEYHLVVTDDYGCSNASATMNAIKSDMKVLIDEGLRYSIIPNPNQGKFIFRIDSHLHRSILLKLINPVGQIIEVRNINPAPLNHSEEFNVSHLSKGIYFLNISNELKNKTEKIIVR